MTVLIALEFNHTLRYVIARESGIVQAQAVILIAQLAVARKVIVTEFYEMPPASVAATAGLVLALGITYWLIRERDAREAECLGALRSPASPASSCRRHRYDASPPSPP
jgi:uncharacterized membrane protein (DUF373 family)